MNTCTIDEPVVFSNIVRILGSVVQEVCIDVTSDRISFSALSDSQIAAVSAHVPVGGNPSPVRLGVKVAEIDKALKGFKDMISVSFNDNTLVLKAGNVTRKIPVYDPQYIRTIPRIPPEGSCRMTLVTKEFTDALAEAMTYTESVSFSTKEGFLSLTGTEDGIGGSSTVELPVNATGTASSRYNGRVLSGIVPLSKFCDRISLAYGDNYPLRITAEGGSYGFIYLQAGIVSDR